MVLVSIIRLVLYEIDFSPLNSFTILLFDPSCLVPLAHTNIS
jgi:hypothetical protein